VKAFLRLSFVLGLALMALGSFARAGESEDLQQKALSLIKVVKAKDWKALYSLMAFTGDLKKVPADDFAKGFGDGIESSGHSKDLDFILNAIQSFSVGKPVIEEDRGYVPTTFMLKVQDRTINFVGIARMVKDDGTWKWDFTGQGDMEKLAELRFEQLIGTIAVTGKS